VQVEIGWGIDQFVDAAMKVLEAAAIYTMNPPGSKKYLVEPEGLVRDKAVGAYATLKALPNDCPFYGC
jgi:hypothetical protein